MSSNFEFVNPQIFWLLLLLPLLLLWFFWKRKQQTAVLKISSLKGFDTSKNWLAKLRPILFVIRLVVLSLIITAMARPRTVDESTRIKTTKGIDIVIAIDVSASMLARDLKPNRLEALKKVANSQSVVASRSTEFNESIKKLGDTYKDFTKSALDQSPLSKLGDDMIASSVKMVGALEDPIAGAARLMVNPLGNV